MDTEETIKRVRTGDTTALSMLIQTYSPIVRKVCFNITNEDEDILNDLVQVVFIRAYYSLNQLRDDSKFGEWAILAEARAYGKDSSAALTVWYNKYLGKLKDYVADKNGVLNSSDIDYTEYSRIVLALTSLGEDATAFTASNGRTYDLVKPLLDKSKTGTYVYQVSEQGTNGTAFALIAMDSAKYYDTTDGNAARDEWISLLLKQQPRRAVIFFGAPLVYFPRRWMR